MPPCDMHVAPLAPRALSFAVIVMVAASSVTACGSDAGSDPGPDGGTASDVDAGVGDAGGSCVPNQAAFCDCTDATVGVMTCSMLGAWSACDCAAPVGPPGDAGDGGADTGADVPVVEDPTCDDRGPIYGDDDLDRMMYPGGNCIGCHTEEGEGERFGAAGTVMPYYGYEDDCAGVPGVTVEITDKNGVVTTMVTNLTGNFGTERTIATPYTARVVRGGSERRMVTPQTDTNCANCHTAAGEEGAFGRIVPP